MAVGGPGAVFWMWLSAILGMTTKFSEVILSITYRVKNNDGSFSGGPMYYIARGLGHNWLAKLFALFGGLASFGIGNMTQSNSISQALEATFHISPIVTGLILAAIISVVILGGIKRIGLVAEKLVPFMAVFYVAVSLLILILNYSKIPNAFGLIFSSAFTGQVATGGFAGSTLMMAMRNGVARGVFSNEAGLGSAPIAHAAATTDHPVRQGMWGVFEVFMDTIVICTMTALVVLGSGAWNSGIQGAALTTTAFESGIKGGQYLVSVGLTLFAFTTILGWSYYGEKCTQYLLGDKFVLPYKFIYIPLVFVGSIGGLQSVWAISDTLNGLMAIPNLIGVFFLSSVVIIMVKDFMKNPDKIRESDNEYLDILPDKFKPREHKSK
uniref:alanine/glycine:cation symporter family protein n=1 Tax=Peptostreptococcus faecalis TaxID=2045015 RepID=UPI002E8E03A7|nr:alanine/glycine:cation symporter family protein [Peptostreptococcus faecalis]